ncbi:MAG: hypothetical protein ACHQKY_11325 [Terriglobia bacterium]
MKLLTDGRGVQGVYDSVGEDTFLKSVNCLAPRGCWLCTGSPVDPSRHSILPC